jgi:hypothetical protein
MTTPLEPTPTAPEGTMHAHGLRGPLRDAMVAQAITPDTRGRFFGFHRAAVVTEGSFFLRAESLRNAPPG